MKITSLERASDWDVEEWLIKKLSLTSYQKDVLKRDEIIRFSPFHFYKRTKKQKNSFLWRLTLIIFPIYLLLLICFSPIKWMITGEWGYGRNFVDNFHSKWIRKLDL